MKKDLLAGAQRALQRLMQMPDAELLGRLQKREAELSSRYILAPSMPHKLSFGHNKLTFTKRKFLGSELYPLPTNHPVEKTVGCTFEGDFEWRTMVA